MPDAHKNFATSLVATAPSPATSGTTLDVTAGQGARYATPPFNAVICPVGVDPTPDNAEVVRVTAITTDALTIIREQEGSSARTVVVGDRIFEAITAKTLTDAEAGTGAGDLAYAESGTSEIWIDSSGSYVDILTLPTIDSGVVGAAYIHLHIPAYHTTHNGCYAQLEIIDDLGVVAGTCITELALSDDHYPGGLDLWARAESPAGRTYRARGICPGGTPPVKLTPWPGSDSVVKPIFLHALGT